MSTVTSIERRAAVPRADGPTSMRLGLSSYAFTWGVGVPGALPAAPLGPLELVEQARELDVEVLQLADNVALTTVPPAQLEELAHAARSSPVTLEVGGRMLTADALRRHVEIARALGSATLRFVIDGPGHRPSDDDVVALLRDHRSLLSDAAITLALENHDRFLAQQLRAIVDAVDSPHVGICLDTVNSLGAGQGVGEVLGELAPVTVNLHVKDFAIDRREHGMGFTVVGARLGDGMLDLPSVLGAVAVHGRCTTAVLEQWAPACPTPAEAVALERDWARHGIDVLRQSLAANGLQPQHEGAR